jgi:hypothetical protein
MSVKCRKAKELELISLIETYFSNRLRSEVRLERIGCSLLVKITDRINRLSRKNLIEPLGWISVVDWLDNVANREAR